jgi:2-keto-3-deoxygluconate permease
MKILSKVKKVPGGILMIPMVIGAIINTFCPSIFRIGDPTTALFTNKGTMVLIGMILLISGSQFKLAQISVTLRRAGVICITKLAITWTVGFAFIRLFGIDGIFGISAVALIAVVASCNPGLYLALMHNYGDEADCAGFGILNLIAVPIVPVLILNASSGVGISFSNIFATLFPFLLGMLLGNLDPEIAKLFSKGTVILLPFLGMSFGSNINLKLAVQSGLSGALVTIFFVLVSMLPLILIDRLVSKRPGYAAAAISSVAGMTLVVPTLASNINPIYEPYVQSAITQIAFAVVFTSVIAPYITKKIFEGSCCGE